MVIIFYLQVILEWDKNGGVLLMGYELFRLLSLKKPVKSKRKRPDEEENERNRNLVEQIYSALVKPGPDLVRFFSLTHKEAPVY